jgi:hypothetical protein
MDFCPMQAFLIILSYMGVPSCCWYVHTYISTYTPKIHHITYTPKIHHITYTPIIHHITYTPKIHHITYTPIIHHITYTHILHHITYTHILHHITYTHILHHITYTPKIDTALLLYRELGTTKNDITNKTILCRRSLQFCHTWAFPACCWLHVASIFSHSILNFHYTPYP